MMDNWGPPGVMIVTGGSRGIGASVSLLAAKRGYSVAVNFAENERAADLIVGDIRKAGAQAVAVQGDVSLEHDVRRLFETVDRELGSLAVLVNNAGITGGFSRVADVSAEMLQHVFAVNVIGSFLCAQEAVKRMSKQKGGKGGSIVNVSSRAAEIGGAGEWVHYAATKGAIETLTVGLAREVALEGIRVNAVSPGLIQTELHATAGAPDRGMRLASGIPIGRPGATEEVAEAILWLASSKASYVTGAVLAVAGGR
jgi:NAD(P)-dependent dehydrogenase (short-subunit alcohol dehydrogenase family)